MQAVAFIDGLTGNTESQNRRAQLPQLSDGPSFRDLLDQIDRSPYNNPYQSQPVSYAPRSSSGELSPYATPRETPYTPTGPEAESSRGQTQEVSHGEASPERSAQSEAHRTRAAEEETSRAEVERSRGEGSEEESARERVAKERDEANLQKAEAAEREGDDRLAARKPEKTGEESSTEEGVALAEKVAGDGSTLPEKDALVAQTKVAEESAKSEGAGERRVHAGKGALPEEGELRRVRGTEGAAGHARGAGDAKRGGGAELAEAKAIQDASRQSEAVAAQSREGAEKSAIASEQNGSERGTADKAAVANAARLRGDGEAAREAATMVASEQKRGSESATRSQRLSAEGESRESQEGAERKLRIVDLRAPREGRDSRNSGGEQNSQSGLKESAEGRQVEGSQSNTVRFEHGESAFARQLGSNSMSRGEGIAERLAQQQQQLHRFLRESGYGEIVRNARVMLREGGNGELRLNLSPKELGSVRVQLQLQDSHIAGRIIVENSTVREVFEQNLDQLQRAFQSQGLETGRLEVSVEQRGDGQQRRGRGEPGRGDGARIFEEHTARLPDSFYEDAQVNLMA